MIWYGISRSVSFSRELGVFQPIRKMHVHTTNSNNCDFDFSTHENSDETIMLDTSWMWRILTKVTILRGSEFDWLDRKLVLANQTEVCDMAISSDHSSSSMVKDQGKEPVLVFVCMIFASLQAASIMT